MRASPLGSVKSARAGAGEQPSCAPGELESAGAGGAARESQSGRDERCRPASARRTRASRGRHDPGRGVQPAVGRLRAPSWCWAIGTSPLGHTSPSICPAICPHARTRPRPARSWTCKRASRTPTWHRCGVTCRSRARVRPAGSPRPWSPGTCRGVTWCCAARCNGFPSAPGRVAPSSTWTIGTWCWGTCPVGRRSRPPPAGCASPRSGLRSGWTRDASIGPS